ncbi:MAG: precorrin-3B synthase [Kiloniellales bacterium]
MTSQVKGWCPSLLRPMQAADGWLLRLKPSCALLPAAKAKQVAKLADGLGNGQMELTQRAGLQLRGFPEGDLEAAAERILTLGLGEEDGAAEARRNIVVSPLLGFDKTIKHDTQSIVQKIESGLRDDAELAQLPDKFGFVVDGGGLLPLDGIAADIVLRCAEQRLEIGTRYAIALGSLDAAEPALALAKGFLRLNRGRFRRLRVLLQEDGIAALLKEAGLDAPYETLQAERAERPAPGFHDQESGTSGALLAYWPFGSLDADALTQAADLSERYGDGCLRLTPWRALAIADVTGGEAPELASGLRTAGALVDRSNPLLRIEACPGQGACTEATVDTRSLARRLAQQLPAEGARLHVSGCSKGCAHPGSAALTLVGDQSRWSLVRKGHANSKAYAKNLTDRQVLDRTRNA